jgi:hypothetical protein
MPTISHKSIYPSPIVLPDSLSVGALGVAFHARPS